MPVKIYKLDFFLFFVFFSCHLPVYSETCLLCSCPQENVLSSAVSAAPLSHRRVTCCVTSSSILGRNPSSVTCAATPVAEGTPSPDIYALTRVSTQRSSHIANLCTYGNSRNTGWKSLQEAKHVLHCIQLELSVI